MNDLGFVKVLALELYGSLYDRQSIAQTVRDFGSGTVWSWGDSE